MQTTQSTQKTDSTMQILIDKVFVPANAIQEFNERWDLSRNFIKKQPGFIEDNAYVRTDENGNLFYATFVIWKNKDAFNKAMLAVQSEYKREGFDMQAMLKRTNVVIERGGIFKKETKIETTQSTQKTDTATECLIDKIFVPVNAIQEFTERMNINRNFIKNLPGFIEDTAYMRTDENGNVICVTVAVWKNKEAIKKAMQEVLGLYKKENFDMQSFLKRLNIVIDRGTFKKETK